MAKANTIKSKRMLGIEEETGTNDTKQSELPKRVFADWLTNHIEGIRRNPAYAASTYRNYRSTVNVIKAYLQHLHRPRLFMSNIDKGFVLGFIDFIEHTYRNTKSPDNPKEMSPHTLHLYQSTLVRMLNAAVKMAYWIETRSTRWNGKTESASNRPKRISDQRGTDGVCRSSNCQ